MFCRDIVDPVIDFFHLLFEALIVTVQASFFFFKEIIEAIFLSKTTIIVLSNCFIIYCFVVLRP